MNNLLSYCGLVNAKIRAPDKDLPVTSSIVEFTEKMGKKSKDPWCHWCKNRQSILGHSSIDCPNRKCPLCNEKGHTRQYCPDYKVKGEDEDNLINVLRKELKSNSFKTKSENMEVVEDLSIEVFNQSKKNLIFEPNEEKEVFFRWKPDFSYRSWEYINELEIYQFGINAIYSVDSPIRVFARTESVAKVTLHNTNAYNCVIKNENAIGKITTASCGPYPCLLLSLEEEKNTLRIDYYLQKGGWKCTFINNFDVENSVDIPKLSGKFWYLNAYCKMILEILNWPVQILFIFSTTTEAQLCLKMIFPEALPKKKNGHLGQLADMKIKVNLMPDVKSKLDFISDRLENEGPDFFPCLQRIWSEIDQNWLDKIITNYNGLEKKAPKPPLISQLPNKHLETIEDSQDLTSFSDQDGGVIKYYGAKAKLLNNVSNSADDTINQNDKNINVASDNGKEIVVLDEYVASDDNKNDIDDHDGDIYDNISDIDDKVSDIDDNVSDIDDNDSDVVELNTINDTDNSTNRQVLASSGKTYISSPSLASEDSSEELMLWELGNHLLALSTPSLNPEKGGKVPNEKKLSGTKRIPLWLEKRKKKKRKKENLL